MKLTIQQKRTVRAALTSKGKNLSTIAKAIGVSRQSVSDVLNGKRTSRKIQKAIAMAAGFRIKELFLDY